MYFNRNYIWLLFFFVNQLNSIIGQIYEINNLDFFYNINLTEPVFDQTVYVQKVNKSTPIDTTVFTFTVRSQLIYTQTSYPLLLSSGTILSVILSNLTVISDHSDFIVKTNNDGTYRLVTNISPLNYSLPYNRYLFNLIATQNYMNRSPIKSTALVQINLLNFNSQKPIFLSNQIFSISEISNINTDFGTIYAYDPDNDNIIYEIENNIQFSINPNTGVLRLQQEFQSTSPLQYNISIIATDDSSSCTQLNFQCQRLTERTNVTVNIIPINKQAPRFATDKCGQMLYFPENKLIDFNLTIYDEDRGEYGKITVYFPPTETKKRNSFMDNPYADFSIYSYPQIGSSLTLSIRSNKIFDYDEPNTRRFWNLFILASDNGIPKRTSLCVIRINLTDLNDNAPIFAMSLWNYTIYNTSTDKNLFPIIASDRDSGINSRINYYISTIDVHYFIINQTTGIIQIRDDIEISNLNISKFPIQFQVFAQDLGIPSLRSNETVNVTIYFNNSANLPVAQWLDQRYKNIQMSISEKFNELNFNKPISDINSTFNGLYFYRSEILKEMILKKLFGESIPFRSDLLSRNNSVYSSGIFLTSNLDAEQKDFYLIYPEVPVNPSLISLTLIKLIDENDESPTFDITSIDFNILENENGIRIIAQIQAYDRDITFPNNYIQYRLNTALSDPEVIGKFFVHSNGTLWTNATFDYESNKKLYQIVITAYDGAPIWNSNTNESNTKNLLVNIQIIDVNDEIPYFIDSSSRTIPINETTAIGTNILNLTIIDKDINTKFNFGILSGNIRNVFIFNFLSDNSDNSSRTEYQATGQLQVFRSLDYEINSNYTLVLFVFDTQHLSIINVIVNLLPENTKAPYFNLMPGFISYQYTVNEKTVIPVLDGSPIEARDPDNPPTDLIFEIVNNNQQLNSTQINGRLTIGINSTDLSWNPQRNSTIYNFSIRVTDQNGTGISSYIPINIKINDINNHAPIPINPPWILTEGIINPSTTILFMDYDDPTQNNTVPYKIQIVSPSTFTFSGPTLSDNGTYILTYNGILNRTITKNLTVTFNVSDNKGYSALTTISVIVGDVLNNYQISNGYKTINIIYVNGYMNSLRNIPLGSVYVNDLDDWFHANRIYLIRDVSNGQKFNVSKGLLSTSDALYQGSYTIRVDVTKPNILPAALSIININVISIDSEYVRQAATIRIQGEYPETLIDPTLGDRLNKLRAALASFLNVNMEQVQILAIHSIYQYENPYSPPLTFDQAKQKALTDVIFYVTSLTKQQIKDKLNANINQFSSSFNIIVNAIEPDPCNNYVCSIGTICRVSRTIKPVPYTIDTNQTSFVGINILDSADCVKSNYSINENITNDCSSLEMYAPLGPHCEVLGRTFKGKYDTYAVFAGSSFSNIAPSRFSFDLTIEEPISDGLILLHGRNTTSINDYFWIAIEIFQSKLRFHFRGTILNANNPSINASIWYHIEYQHVDSIILISINDYQYTISIDDTSNVDNLSDIQLYLGGLPSTGSLISSLYPSLTEINSFRGCIRNIFSNGYYVDMRNSIAASNSDYGQCSCTVTKSCVGSIAVRTVDLILSKFTRMLVTLILMYLSNY